MAINFSVQDAIVDDHGETGIVGDAAATTALRSQPRALAPTFSLGPVRLALEAQWPTAASAALATAALRAPDGIRTHALAAIRADVAVHDSEVTAAAVDAAASRYFNT